MGRPTKPLKEIDPRADAFEIPGGPDAALLVHGFTGTPAEMRPLGEMISEKFGWNVSAPLLPGHGTTVEDLAGKKTSDWSDCVEAARTALARNHKRIHLAGISMGADLCLESFRKNPEGVASLCLLVPALWFRSPLHEALGRLFSEFFLPPFPKTWPKRGPVHPGRTTYDRYPMTALLEFFKIMKRTRKLPAIQTPPAIIIHTLSDEVIHKKSAYFLKERLKNPANRFVELEHADHLITDGAEKNSVLSEIERFYREVISLS